jgi:hypothetical protein
MNSCDKCRDLNQVFRIVLPGDLKTAIRVAKNNINDETISVIEKESGNSSRPFTEISESRLWNDNVHYVFKCNFCGQRFLLNAETYHGSGGEWKPIK